MRKEKKRRSWAVRFIAMIIKLTAIMAVLAIGMNIFVIKSTEGNIVASVNTKTDTVSDSEVEKLRSINPECILVLGAAVKPDGTPSKMLEDRLKLGIELYKKGVAPKLLFSGDNGQVIYNEVKTMKNYAISAGVPRDDIFLDHAGFSTYESVYRANHIFYVDSMVVVTQGYHLNRALYGCKRMGITAFGAAADQKRYPGQIMRDAREVLARDKDMIKWLIKPQPTFLGDGIPIDGNGMVTQ